MIATDLVLIAIRVVVLYVLAEEALAVGLHVQPMTIGNNIGIDVQDQCEMADRKQKGVQPGQWAPTQG